jgi:hypothetical protein
MGTPRLSRAQAWSAVITRHSRWIAKAMQARSPSESPKSVGRRPQFGDLSSVGGREGYPFDAKRLDTGEDGADRVSVAPHPSEHLAEIDGGHARLRQGAGHALGAGFVKQQGKQRGGV